MVSESEVVDISDVTDVVDICDEVDCEVDICEEDWAGYPEVVDLMESELSDRFVSSGDGILTGTEFGTCALTGEGRRFFRVCDTVDGGGRLFLG